MGRAVYPPACFGWGARRIYIACQAGLRMIVRELIVGGVNIASSATSEHDLKGIKGTCAGSDAQLTI